MPNETLVKDTVTSCVRSYLNGQFGDYQYARTAIAEMIDDADRADVLISQEIARSAVPILWGQKRRWGINKKTYR